MAVQTNEKARAKAESKGAGASKATPLKLKGGIDGPKASEPPTKRAKKNG